MRGWDLVLPGPRNPYKSQVEVQQRASGGGVSTSCGAVSTRAVACFVAGSLEL